MNTQEYAAALGVKRVWVEDIERFFDSHDVLLAPVAFGPAFKRCKVGSLLDFDGALRRTTSTAGPTLSRSTRAAIQRWSCRSARRRMDCPSAYNSSVHTGRNLSSCTSRDSWPR